MFKINNKFITTSELDVILQLQLELHNKGIDKLRHVKVIANNIMVTCPNPNHKGGQEKSPDCGISTGDKAGMVHCFACGYTADITDFISLCFGYKDRGHFGTEWLLSNFVIGVVSERKRIKILRRERKESEDKYITEEELDKYRYVHPYMYKRKLTDEIIDKFDVGYDEETKCITFPVCDENGNCLFIARRSVKTKYFNYPSGVEKPLYGLHFIKEDIKEVIICESIINALTCWSYGKPAIALIGLGSKVQVEKLKNLNVRKLIIAFDGDEAGIIATNKLRKKLEGNRKIISQYNLSMGKDINDLTMEEFINLKEYY